MVIILRRFVASILCVGLLSLVPVGTVACSRSPVSPPRQNHGSVAATETFDNSVKKPAPAVPPPPPMTNRGPEQAVYSYLLWISFAYRILNSAVASPTYSIWEEVRVDSYVQYNKQQGRAIDQRLLLLKLKRKPVISNDTTATVAAVERWKYRYISLETKEYSSPWYDVTYDTTYTVVRDKDRGGAWVVDKVEAKARGEVK